MNHIGQDVISDTTKSVSPVIASMGPEKQKTLLRTMNCVGIALHSGEKVSLTLRPAEAYTGIIFRRIDIPGSKEIVASWDNVVDTRMCTTLGSEDGVTISTVEHLMSALAGCGVDNVYVDVNGPEVPVMDGSAQPFVFLIECAGLLEQDAPRRVIEILKPVRVEIGDKMAELIPSDTFSVGFEIDFESEVVAKQEITVTMVNGSFKKEVARARTFGFMHEVEQLRAAGLGLGGSLDNAVIVEGDKVLNEDGLRYDDEFVRHKVLDAVGDLYLAGGVFLGSYKGVRSGHALTNQLLRALFADKSAWRYVDFAEESAVEVAPKEAEVVNLVAATA
ncbi:MAG: UDP-3-O-acyl-N-acetylglucosamine deacetylase [Rhodospirillaceae bacterium]|jgi:UDP-3-O-[3-hydroxymyristoyl] N-acetylglucosamine deacetylase|nr:UDP-3-O-acyl-N-acetylglucosamine deacetylase [Rhodospirillaceae bacterium]MBT4589486.1 UDP-3-O-acyl-N-acetylglucosamine deacetylase [Rhodospirillaceae bacterium]MBT5940880.1 UDP-3-O-acyl-N-acetylglucosamine deacetylase [Rhodospirillaceae bacterium]MBT7268244.1 UDP-3-O-acyl-N-acetylglucosamine deacetylase [Rhodospirillaceae bacterium]